MGKNVYAAALAGLLCFMLNLRKVSNLIWHLQVFDGRLLS